MYFKSPLGLSFLSLLDGGEIYCPGTRKAWSPKILKEPLFFKLLSYFRDSRTKEEAVEFINEYNKTISLEEIDKILDYLINKGLIIKSSEKEIDTKKRWCAHNWDDSLIYHWHTNLYPKYDYWLDPRDEFDTDLMRLYVESEKRPSNYKSYEEVKSTQLTNNPLALASSVPQAFELKQSNDKSKNIITFEEFSRLCFLAFGETGSKNIKVTGRFITKTIPSGGARHPTEIYPVVLEDIEGVEPGLYHYNVQSHKLEQILLGNLTSLCRDHILLPPDRIWFQPKVIFLYTCIFDRSMFRYRESRSYRVMHYDLGHIMQNLRFLANSLGRHLYGGYSLHDSEIEKILNIDGILESIMGYSALA